MTTGVDFGESLDAEVGVNLGGRELLVAEHLMLAATETLYLDAKHGCAGYGLKKDGEPVEKCSTIDDIISFTQDGKMRGFQFPV